MTQIKDEIGAIVAANTADPRELLAKKKILKKQLPLERAVDQWPDDVAVSVKKRLAQMFPVINLVAILQSIHTQKISKFILPRFAVFDAFNTRQPCQISMRACNFWVEVSAKSFGWPREAFSVYRRHLTTLVVGKATDVGNRIFWRGVQASAVTTAVAVSWLIGNWIVTAQLAVSLLVFFGVCLGPLILSVVTALGFHSWFDRTYALELSADFQGTISEAVRDKCRKLQPMFDNILIVQEVQEWNSKLEVTPDPLVVGVKDNVYYLLDRFDVTPREEYMAREFSTGPEA